MVLCALSVFRKPAYLGKTTIYVLSPNGASGGFVGGFTADFVVQAAVYAEPMVRFHAAENVSESENESESILRTVFHNGGSSA